MLVPTNAKTGNAYTSGNIFKLLETGYTDQVWATYRQWQELGYQVQKGEKGTRLIKMVTVINKKAKDDEAKKRVCLEDSQYLTSHKSKRLSQSPT